MRFSVHNVKVVKAPRFRRAVKTELKINKTATASKTEIQGQTGLFCLYWWQGPIWQLPLLLNGYRSEFIWTLNDSNNTCSNINFQFKIKSFDAAAKKQDVTASP